MGAEDVRARGGVRYRELQARSLVNRCSSPRMPFAYTANPYRGCAMACRYCYATYTHEFMGITAAEDFHSLVYVKTSPPRALSSCATSTCCSGSRRARASRCTSR
jgi:DNA repair photolyase